ncbi:MAG: GAF domain-containing protein [Anaerolineae bacterium]|nr:GAF domain-containing protein [Anaerolineae bacterium]
MRISLRTRLTVAFIGLAILPPLLMGLVLAQRSLVVQQQQALALQGEVARRVSTAVEAFVRGLEGELRMAVEVQGLGELSLAQQEGNLSKLLSYQGSFAELILLDSQGREEIRLARLKTISPDQLGDRSEADEFVLPRQTTKTYYSPVRFDQVLGEPLMTIAVPIVVSPRVPGAGGQVQGVLVADARLKQMWDVIAGIPVGEGESVYIVSAEGRVIAHRNPATVLRGTRFEVPAEDGIHPGLDEGRVVLATESIQFGAQELRVVAEKATAQALNLATSTLLITGVLTAIALVIAVGLGLFTVGRIVQPVEELVATTQAVTAGDLSQQIRLRRRDEIGRLGEAFNSMTTRLRETLAGLEERVAERTHDAERRALQVQAAAEVGRAAASIRDLDDLLTQVTHLISERFGFYHAGIFLLDSTGEYVVLRAANSPGGQRMLARGHRLRVGEAGIVGYVTGRRESRIALNVGQDAVFFDNPDLPETRSEMALPLMAGGQLLGALDVQSREAGAFSEEDVDVLRLLADQVAVSIENAQLFAESQRALEVERRIYGQLSRDAWREILRSQQAAGYRCNRQGVYALEAPKEGAPKEGGPGDKARGGRGAEVRGVEGRDRCGVLGDPREAAPGEAAPKESAPKEGGTASCLLLPIRVRDQVLGTVALHKPEEAGAWTADERALMETLTDQLSVALESARLYSDTQRRAARERLIGEVTAHMRESLDIETVLKTTASEMRQVLDLDNLVIRLAPPERGRGYSPSGPPERDDDSRPAGEGM